MKNRNLFNNIFTIIIMLSLVFFLLSYFSVFGNETLEGWIQKITLPLALLSAICMEIVLPVLDNKETFKTEKKMRILLLVKIFLVVAAIVPLVLNITGTLTQNTKAEFGVLAAFVILYMAQFFINLDPKPIRSEEEDEEDYDEDYDEEDEDPADEENEDDEDAEEAGENVAAAEEVSEEVPAVEEAAPAVEEAAPAVEEAAPAEEEIAPVVEEAVPAEEETVSEEEETVPAEEQPEEDSEEEDPAQQG